MLHVGTRTARAFAAGFLAAYGFLAFICFISLDMVWEGTAPDAPNVPLGLIYRHNEHGSYTYFSSFQATTCGLMFLTSIPLAFVGALIVPKSELGRLRPGLGWRYASELDDPKNTIRGALAGAIATPIIVFGLGPLLIEGLNKIGLVLNLG